MKFPKKLKNKIEVRTAGNALRRLKDPSELIDFSSNDYLGCSRSASIFDKVHQFLVDRKLKINGATGSRLLSGNHGLYSEVESMLCDVHHSEAVLIFNSGYDANIGFFAAVPQRGDIILYDEFIHASIRDGIKMSHAKSFKFKHNDLGDLEDLLKRNQETSSDTEIYIVTEAVFSMDGDAPDLIMMSQVSKKYSACFIVDEAHALGVFGKQGCGMVQKLHLEKDVFARIITFGKALGCHGAAILGSRELKEYLVNFSRSFIYTTALPPHSLATIHCSYKELNLLTEASKLQENIQFFRSEIKRNKLQDRFIESHSAIHCCLISGNQKVRSISQKLQEKGFDVKAILSPTVPEHKERLRFCLHSYNSHQEITEVLTLLSTFVK